MLGRDELVAQLNQLFEVGLFTDYCPNGLQVEGRPTIRRVVTGVTSSLALIERAVEMNADALVVHHGILWDGASMVLRGAFRKRVSALLKADLNLLAYHLPLDRHSEIGNNAPALRDLGGTDLAPFALYKGQAVGWRATLAVPAAADAFLARVSAYYGTDALAFPFGPPEIRTVGMVSGAAQGDLNKAVAAGLDCFITGEVSEYNMHIAKEEGIHHISVGHHASERVGPRCLANWLSTRMGLDATFVDLPNPA